jgi:hypothetical protein
LAVVAGRSGDHAYFALCGAELRHQVDATANLESAGREMELVLEVDIGAGDLADSRRLTKWSGREIRPNARRRGQHV